MESPKTVHIPLTQGLSALVDEEDLSLVSGLKWHAHRESRTFYAMRSETRDGRQISIYMHWVIMGRKGIDHINHNGLDNRKSNLRPATVAQQNANQRAKTSSKTGLKGVTRFGDKWVARIWSEGARRYIGIFGTPEEAHDAYMATARQVHGEFASQEESR